MDLLGKKSNTTPRNTDICMLEVVYEVVYFSFVIFLALWSSSFVTPLTKPSSFLNCADWMIKDLKS